MKTLLWLDDYRDPYNKEVDWLVFSPLSREDLKVYWAKSYDSFVHFITNEGLPDAICFDHDLSDFQAFKAGYPDLMEDVPTPITEKTGFDCAKWLIDYCMDNNKPLPLYNIQSANPVGKENIDKLLKNYLNKNRPNLCDQDGSK